MIRRVLSAGAHLATGTVVQALLALIGNLILLRALGPSEFGRFAVTLAGLSVIATVLSLRLGIVVIRTPESEFTPELQNRYFTAMLAETAIVAAVSGAWLVASGRTTWANVLLVGAVSLQAFCSHARSFWERTMPYRTIAVVETGVVAVTQASGVAVVLVTESEVALYVREATSALAVLFALLLVGGLSWRPLVRPRLREWREVFREARSVWFDSMLEGVFQRVNVLAAGALAGEQGAGYFSMAQRLALLPHQLIQPFGRVATTWFSRTIAAADRRQARDRLIVILALPLSIAVFATVLLADAVVPWVFGAHWHGAVPVLIAMSGAMLFITIFEITRAFALVTKQTRALLGARIGQVAAFGVAAGAGWWHRDTALIYLGIGVSAAFVAAFAIQLLILRRQEMA